MNLKGVSFSTWVRMISMVVILVNLFGMSFFDVQLVPFDDEQVYEGVSAVLTIVVGVWASWKNNSFTKKAQQADKQLKGGVK